MVYAGDQDVHELRKIFWTVTDRVTELTGIICCITRMIITGGEAAVKFRWPGVLVS